MIVALRMVGDRKSKMVSVSNRAELHRRMEGVWKGAKVRVINERRDSVRTSGPANRTMQQICGVI